MVRSSTLHEYRCKRQWRTHEDRRKTPNDEQPKALLSLLQFLRHRQVHYFWLLWPVPRCQTIEKLSCVQIEKIKFWTRPDQSFGFSRERRIFVVRHASGFTHLVAIETFTLLENAASPTLLNFNIKAKWKLRKVNTFESFVLQIER